MTLHTTLNRLREAKACSDRYEHLLRALGGVKFDHDAPINLLTILEHNGVDDCLWALCATVENCDRVARLMACDFAGSVLPIFERHCPDDGRPREAIEVASRFARGEVTNQEMAAAGAAAWAARAAAWAARAAAWAARAAAWAASDAAWAASDAAWAARAAAWAAGAAARDAQGKIVRAYLLADEHGAA